MEIPLPELPDLLSNLPSPMKGNSIIILLDGSGKIIEIKGSRQAMRYASIAEEISREKKIQDLFDISPYADLNEIPELSEPGITNKYVSFANKRHFRRLEDPERFYASIPTVQISIFRPEKNLFAGFVRPLDSLPNIGLESLSCIIYTDEQERLRGFNHTFYQFFKDLHPDPEQMLNRPIGDFLLPPPAALHKAEITGNPLAPASRFKTLFEADFRASGSFQGLTVSDPKSVSFSRAGMTCVNRSDDIIFFMLPVTVDSRNDILFSADAEILNGVQPVLFLGREFDPALFQEGYPDTEGYLAGPDSNMNRYVLKRKSAIQHVGQVIGALRNAEVALAKSGRVLRYLENREERLAFCDFNFLHERRARLTLGVRIGTSLTLRSIRAAVMKNDRPPTLPLTRFKNTGETYALLSRISNVALSMRFPDVSIYLLENITEIQRQVNLLRRENRRLMVEMGMTDDGFIGKSPSILAIKRNAAIVANSNATILIQGETGTGKEQLARHIHDQSLRRQGPFIKVDCSTLSRTLMESELFGHEKGAFTGAEERKAGSFERADRGTLFLDEVGNLPLETQAKLLHFLQDHTITRVGGTETFRVDARVIVASNASLADLVKKGLFRSDLFFRMDVVSITLPPLRERMDDIPDFCRAFLSGFNATHHKSIKDLSPAAYQKIYGYGWPGNIREFKNTLERAAIFCEEEFVGEELIRFSMDGAGPEKAARKRNPYQFGAVDINEVRALLEKHRGNMKLVALDLKMPKRTLYYKLRRAGHPAASLKKAL